MGEARIDRLGLVVRSAPGNGRSNRDQLDLALAAASLEIELDLYFLGHGLLHLIASRQPQAAHLPPGHKAWQSLPELTTVHAFAESGRLRQLHSEGIALALEVEPLEASEMAAMQLACDRVLVI